MDARCLRYTVSGQEKSLSIPPGEYAGNGETQRYNSGVGVSSGLTPNSSSIKDMKSSKFPFICDKFEVCIG